MHFFVGKDLLRAVEVWEDIVPAKKFLLGYITHEWKWLADHRKHYRVMNYKIMPTLGSALGDFHLCAEFCCSTKPHNKELSMLPY